MKLKEFALWAALVVGVVVVVWPASHWYDAGEMRVDDFSAGADFDLIYDGGAVRKFLGSYSVVMTNTDVRKIVAEMGSARFNYDPANKRPDPLLISWWAPNDPRFLSQPPGHYRLETCWTVHGAFFGFSPGKQICTRSNIFTIHPK